MGVTIEGWITRGRGDQIGRRECEEGFKILYDMTPTP